MQLLMILVILFVGMGIGWIYCWYFKVKPLKNQNKSLRKIEVEEIVTRLGKIEMRTSEFPLDAEEYLNFHSLERDGGIIEISFDGMEKHLDTYSYYLLDRQKRDFMKMCKQIKHGNEILTKLEDK